jgi:hypothetical protein
VIAASRSVDRPCEADANPHAGTVGGAQAPKSQTKPKSNETSQGPDHAIKALTCGVAL